MTRPLVLWVHTSLRGWAETALVPSLAEPCSKCLRPNSARRSRCLYCDNPLPVRPDQKEAKSAIPDNLDELVAKALAGGGTGELRAALEGKPNSVAQDIPVSQLESVEVAEPLPDVAVGQVLPPPAGLSHVTGHDLDAPDPGELVPPLPATAAEPLGQREEALAAYGQTLAQNPDYARAHQRMAEIYARQGEQAAAARPDQ